MVSNTFPIKSQIITGSFCEFRGNHFHTGLDLSINGQIGMPVYAPVNGYISYIKQDFLGYGKAIFLKSDSIIYVFAHLHDFSPKIKSQLKTNKFRQLLYPSFNTIKMKEGDLIGFAGHSGASIPHLHFEMRSLNNNPVNPRLYFDIKDNKYPEISKIIIEPIGNGTLINGKHELSLFKGKKLSKSYYNFPTAYITGNFRIYPQIIDRANSLTARLFVYKVDIYSSGKHIYSFKNDSVSFGISKYSPLMFKGDLDIKNRKYIFNPHADIDTWFSLYPLRTLNSLKDTLITIVCTDISGNRTVATLKINSYQPNKVNRKYTKLCKVDGKINFIISGKNHVSNYKTPKGFKIYENKDYLYYVFDTTVCLSGPVKILGNNIDYNFIYINRNKPFLISKDIRIESNNLLYALHNTIDTERSGITFSTPLYQFDLSKQFNKKYIKYIISGYPGKSIYMFNGSKFRFIRKLSYCDTIISHYLQSFIIGKDTEKPKSKFKSVKTINGEKVYTYSITDNISGIDWIFVSDSNSIYNIPDPFNSQVKIFTKSKKDTLFFIQDKEGNRIIIRL